MLQRDTPEDFVIATGETHTLEDFVAGAFQWFGLDWRRHVDFDPTLIRPTDLSVSAANPGKAREQSGMAGNLEHGARYLRAGRGRIASASGGGEALKRKSSAPN